MLEATLLVVPSLPLKDSDACGLRAVEELSVELPRQRRDRFDRVWPFLATQSEIWQAHKTRL